MKENSRLKEEASKASESPSTILAIWAVENGEYEAPREVLRKLDAELTEMKRCKTRGLCCGAGGAQMFKEAEKGDKEVNIERTEDALEVKPDVIAAGCPFCNTMMTDGVKNFNKEEEIKVMDIAELIAQAADL